MAAIESPRQWLTMSATTRLSSFYAVHKAERTMKPKAYDAMRDQHLLRNEFMRRTRVVAKREYPRPCLVRKFLHFENEIVLESV